MVLQKLFAAKYREIAKRPTNIQTRLRQMAVDGEERLVDEVHPR